MSDLDEAVAGILAAHPARAARFHTLVRKLRNRRGLKPLLPSDPVKAYEQVPAALERVLVSKEWRGQVTVRVKLTRNVHNATVNFSGLNDPALHAAHLTALVYLDMLRIATYQPQEFAWTNLLERLKSSSLIRGLFPCVSEEQINRCLVTLHDEGCIGYVRTIAVHKPAPPSDLG